MKQGLTVAGIDGLETDQSVDRLSIGFQQGQLQLAGTGLSYLEVSCLHRVLSCRTGLE